MELLSSLYHYCCRSFLCIADGVGQEEFLHTGLSPEEEAVTLIWCDTPLLHTLMPTTTIPSSARIWDHALVPAGALLLRRLLLSIHWTWRKELAHIFGIVCFLVRFKDSGT